LGFKEIAKEEAEQTFRLLDKAELFSANRPSR
jgi:hypothetical protein